MGEENFIKFIINIFNEHYDYNIEEFKSKSGKKEFWGIMKENHEIKEKVVFLYEKDFDDLEDTNDFITKVLVVKNHKGNSNWNILAQNYSNIIVIDEKSNKIVYYSPNENILASQINNILNYRKKIKSQKRSFLKSKVTVSLIAVNVIMYIITVILSKNILNSDIDVLLFLGAKQNTLIASGEYYRLITCMFLHGGLVHIALNMYALNALGPMVEKTYGKINYLIIYFIGGILSSVASYVFSDGVSIGASGAIFALLGAILGFALKVRKTSGDGMIKNIISVIAINIFIGFTIPNIDNFAHLGGVLGGIVLGLLLRHIEINN